MPDDYITSFVKKRRSPVKQSSYSARQHDYNDKLVGQELDQRAAEFTVHRDVVVCIGTFNVNGRTPGEGDGAAVRDWLADGIPGIPAQGADAADGTDGTDGTGGGNPDIYAIGCQETDLSKEAFVRNNSTHEDNWAPRIEAAITAGGAEYTKLMSKQLVGMLLIVYVKADLGPHIKNVVAGSIGTGVMGMMGNKGGVTIRFELYSDTLCFVCAHLAAHADQERCLRRNQDYRQIIQKTELTDSHDKPWGILDHDHIFFFGDLNYRVDELSYDEVREQVTAGSFLQLLHVEQLQREHKAGRVLEGFTEAPITFLPTYKYEPGTDNWDEKKMQTPSWCDRILWKGNIQPLAYTSHPKFQLSDHKPVRGVYRAKVATIAPERHAVVLQSILRNLDAIENSSMPDAAIDTNQCDFGTVKYMQDSARTIQISNIGKVVLRFNFKPKPGEEAVVKPWLEVVPSTGVIGPGESVTVTLSLSVTGQLAADLNTGRDTLDDILILGLVNGKDYFVTITGQWQRTSFCTEFEQLVRMQSAAATVPPGPLTPELATPMQVPKELWVLTNHLLNVTLDESDDNIFTEGGVSDEELQRNITSLDDGTVLSNNTHAVAELYLRFLDACPGGGVVPAEFHKRCIDARSSYAACRQVINRLDPVRQQAFLYVVAFLRFLIDRKSSQLPEESGARQQETEGLRGKFAILFGTTLLKTSATTTESSTSVRKKAQFVAQFLSNPDVRDVRV